jgi:large subunit ribosomal protein L10
VNLAQGDHGLHPGCGPNGRTLLYFVRAEPEIYFGNINSMAISKDKKSEILAKLGDAFKEASSVAFVGFSKLTVDDASKMRKDLSQNGVRYYVAKKTLIRKALAERGYEGEIPELPGEVAVAWTVDDVTAPARGVYEYGRKLKGAVSLIGGVFDGVFSDKGQMTAIATIPPVPVLRGMFVNVLNSPIQGFVTALDKIREQKTA